MVSVVLDISFAFVDISFALDRSVVLVGGRWAGGGRCRLFRGRSRNLLITAGRAFARQGRPKSVFGKRTRGNAQNRTHKKYSKSTISHHTPLSLILVGIIPRTTITTLGHNESPLPPNLCNGSLRTIASDLTQRGISPQVTIFIRKFRSKIMRFVFLPSPHRWSSVASLRKGGGWSISGRPICNSNKHS